MKTFLAILALCCISVAHADEERLLVGAIQQLKPALFCKTAVDACALAQLYDEDRVKGDAVFLEKNKEAKCNIRDATFTVIGEVTTCEGKNGLLHVVEVEAADQRHFIVTTMGVEKYVPYMTKGVSYGSEARYCKSATDMDAIARAVVTDGVQAGSIFNAKRNQGQCGASTISFSVIEEVSAYTGTHGTARVVKVHSGNGIHYILTELEVHENATPMIIPVADFSSLQEELSDER